MAKLTAKQKRFCDEYLVCLNATESAKKAGYSEKTAYAIGNENLQKQEIKEYIEKRQTKVEELLGFSKISLLSKLLEIVEKTMTEKPQIRNGEPTGKFVFDAGSAQKAIAEINKMMGYYAPTKVDASITSPEELLGLLISWKQTQQNNVQ